MILLPQGLKALKQVAKQVGLDLRGAYLNLDGGFDSTPNRKCIFNNTLRQRASRLVRATLSFSKKLANHIGAITYCICHYNLEKAGALPV